MNMRISFLLSCCKILLPGICFCLQPLYAQEGGASTITLRVRTVRAIRNAGEQGVTAKTALTSKALDSRIQDLRSQIEQLPYRKFRLASTQRFIVPLKRKHVIRIGNGQLLKVRLHYLSDKRVGIWFNWSDREGMEILSSRMHFDPGQAMVAGAERTDNRGLILAINVVE